MKKILLSLSALLLAAVILVSCSKNTPKEVANTWLTSFYHMDYDAAKKVSTDDTKNLLSQLQQLSSMVSDSSKKELKKITVTIKDVKETGDKATVIYGTSDNAGKDLTLNLVKQNNQWLVQFSKNDNMGDAGAAGDQTPGADSTGMAPAPADSASGAAPDTSAHQ